LSDIFREIDEELRRDNLEKLWRRYGSWIIGAAVFAVLVTAGIVGWREHQFQERQSEGARYTAALELGRLGQDEKALEGFRSLAAEAGSGHALLARFEAAAVQAKTGDDKGAAASYRAIAADGSVDVAYRNLATVLAALHGVGGAEPKTIIDELKPLADGDTPWRPTAVELIALAQLRAGDRAAAIESYKRLADDLAAPPALRARAAEMVAALAANA
jgi:hypothetical protein